VALYVVLAVVAGLIGIVGSAGLILLWVNPPSLGSPERPTGWFFGIAFLVYGGAFGLCLMATRLARQRARPISSGARRTFGPSVGTRGS
jgi:hypothetical protein